MTVPQEDINNRTDNSIVSKDQVIVIVFGSQGFVGDLAGYTTTNMDNRAWEKQDNRGQCNW